jgi:hypothetical protein
MANKIMMSMLEKSKNLTFTDHSVTIVSSLKDETKEQLNLLSEEIRKTLQ